MAKSELRIKARKMREKGESVKAIARLLGVSKSSVSLWVRDIILTFEQYQTLQKRSIKGGEKGRIIGAFIQKKRRLDTIIQMENLGIQKFLKLSDKEFFTAGIALYWAEGTKKKREFCLCNSDPNLIVFMIRWMDKFFGIKISQIKAVVGINEIHRNRDGVVKDFWSNVTGIPLSQFRQTSFKKSKVSKVYENFNEHYGTLGIHVLKGSQFYYKMLGLIKGLSQAGVLFKAG